MSYVIKRKRKGIFANKKFIMKEKKRKLENCVHMSQTFTKSYGFYLI